MILAALIQGSPPAPPRVAKAPDAGPASASRAADQMAGGAALQGLRDGWAWWGDSVGETGEKRWKSNCIGCGFKVDLAGSYDDYVGQIKCFACGAIMEIATQQVKSGPSAGTEEQGPTTEVFISEV